MQAESTRRSLRLTIIAVVTALALVGAGAPFALAHADEGQAGSLAVGTMATKKTAAKTKAATVKKPIKAKISSAKSNAAGKATIKVGSVKGAKGYQYKIALDKKLTKSAKTKTTTKRTYTFSSLKQGKKYYAKVRAYKVANGKKIWGNWSNAKAVTVKKAAKSTKATDSAKAADSTKATDSAKSTDSTKATDTSKTTDTSYKDAYVGTWKLVKMSQNGTTTGSDQIARLSKLGLSVTLTLNENGKATLDYFGNKLTGTWKATSATQGTLTTPKQTIKSTTGTVTANEQTIAMKRSGSTLTVTQSNSSLTFEK